MIGGKKQTTFFCRSAIVSSDSKVTCRSKQLCLEAGTEGNVRKQQEMKGMTGGNHRKYLTEWPT